MIELLLGEIEESGETTTQPGELVNRIRGRLESQEAETDTQGSQIPQTTQTKESQPEEPSTGSQEDEEGSHSGYGQDKAQLKIKVNPDSQMKGIDAMLIIKNIEETAEVVSTTPSNEQIEDGNFEDWFEVVLKGNVDEVKNIMGKLPQIKEYKLDLEQVSEEQGTGEEGEEEREGAYHYHQKKKVKALRKKNRQFRNKKRQVLPRQKQNLRVFSLSV